MHGSMNIKGTAKLKRMNG